VLPQAGQAARWNKCFLKQMSGPRANTSGGTATRAAKASDSTIHRDIPLEKPAMAHYIRSGLPLESGNLLTAIKIESTMHQIPQAPPVASFSTPSPV
jgi:hypothetical protein